MNLIVALLAVLVLSTLPLAGAHSSALAALFAVVLPYLAVVVFLGGIVLRVVGWARSPVPFRIPTSCGQQRSLPWIRSSTLDNPHTGLGVLGRMALEVLCFRSLFRNTKVEIEGKRVVYGPNKWLWLGGIVFHYSMLLVVLRHLRFFTDPVPAPVLWLQGADGFFQIGLPAVYLSTAGFLAGLAYLFFRRVLSAQLRYLSLAADYLPVLVLLGIGTTGVLLRHFVKADLQPVKDLVLGLVAFRPGVPAGLHPVFFVHLFLVCFLLLTFPFGKLMHAAGVFLSPTRNLANNSRARRHINPWNPKVEVHTYEEYEEEFRERMVGAGIPVDKE
jgi:nitrate reductase gamma subunit